MTIGPAPMIRIDLMSVRFGIGPRTFLSSFRGAPISANPESRTKLCVRLWIPGPASAVPE